jgi:hypothetical protein
MACSFLSPFRRPLPRRLRQGKTHRLRAPWKPCCKGAKNRLLFYVNFSVNLQGGEAGAQTFPPHCPIEPAIAAIARGLRC